MGNAVTFLIADDDPDDRKLVMRAFKKSKKSNNVYFVRDGEDLLNYLGRLNGYTAQSAPTPDVILLDLNMPRMDGIETLKHLKSNKTTRDFPVIIMTTSASEDDIQVCYGLGAFFYLVKPMRFSDLVKAFDELSDYWIQALETSHKM